MLVLDNNNYTKKNSETNVEQINKPKKKISTFISVLSLILSVMVFSVSVITNIQPNWNPWNQNVEQKALAGNIDAQMFLADVNFQVGNMEKSVLFYSLVTYNANLSKIDERYNASIAFNNIGYILGTASDNFPNTLYKEEYTQKHFVNALSVFYPLYPNESRSNNYSLIKIAHILWENFMTSCILFDSLTHDVVFIDERAISNMVNVLFANADLKSNFFKDGFYRYYVDLYTPDDWDTSEDFNTSLLFPGYKYFDVYTSVDPGVYGSPEEASDEWSFYSLPVSDQIKISFPELKEKKLIIGFFDAGMMRTHYHIYVKETERAIPLSYINYQKEKSDT